jgi:hypothetical protein
LIQLLEQIKPTTSTPKQLSLLIPENKSEDCFNFIMDSIKPIMDNKEVLFSYGVVLHNGNIGIATNHDPIKNIILADTYWVNSYGRLLNRHQDRNYVFSATKRFGDLTKGIVWIRRKQC